MESGAGETAISSAVSRGPSRIVLTPGRSTRTTQLISWTMGQKTGGMRVQHRPAGVRSISSVAAKPRAQISATYSGTDAPRYMASLTRLKPGTSYRYRIVTKHGSTSWYTFRTQPSKPRSTTFIGLGDTQIDNPGVPRATVRAAIAAAPRAAAVLHAGDVVHNPTRDDEWAGLFSAIGTSGRTRDWIVAAGNHERCVPMACSSGNAHAYRIYFPYSRNGFPKQAPTWFYVDYPGVRVVVLDSFAPDAATTQASFLDRALSTNEQAFSVVLMHAPVFSSAPGKSAIPAMRTIQRIIEKRNVDLVLSGHDHSYARGARSPHRTVFVTSVSGPSYAPVSRAGWDSAGARRSVWAEATSTYQVITISGRTLSYKAVVTSKGSTTTSSVRAGGVLDRLVIDKTRSVKVVR